MEEEINFREFFEVLMRGKWIIIGIAFFGVLIAGIISFFMLPPKFEASSTIIFDKYFIQKQDISIESYKEIITSLANLELLYKNLWLSERGYSVESIENSIITSVNDNQVIITAVVSKPDLAQKIANYLGQNSVEGFRHRLINDKEKAINKLEKSAQLISKKLSTTPQLINTTNINLEGNQIIQIPQVNPLYDRIATRWEQINHELNWLMIEREDLLDELQLEGSCVTLRQAQLPEKPIKPQKTLVVAIGGIVGMMFGILLAFCLEFCKHRNNFI